MTLVTLADGTERDIDLDIDAICAYEEEHPDWSITDLFNSMDTKIRFTDLNLMATFLGFSGFSELFNLGISGAKMYDIVRSSKYMGFTDSEEEE